MKILVFSATPWSDDNSFGLSFSDIFDNIDGLQFASIYSSDGQPDSKFNMRYFQITMRSLVENLKNPKFPTGRIVTPSESYGMQRTEKEQSIFDTARKLRWQILFWTRDFVWKVGRWKSPELKKFLDDFKPDIIFQPVYFPGYLNEIALFIKQYTGAPMVGYISDDNYTLHQWNLSPLYWIDRLSKRRKVKKVIEKCEILYVISDIQKEEYGKIFTPPCKILTKSADFSNSAPNWEIPAGKIKMLYAGNLGSDRWRSLSLIADSVEKLNSEGYDIELNIYSATPFTQKMKNALGKNGCYIHPPVPYKTVQEMQQKDDILVHVEGLSLKSRTAVHQSFSTKLVDFFALGKCIFAVGEDDEASIKHLIDNDAAIVAKNSKEVYTKLKELLEHKELLRQYGLNAYRCGAEHHNKKEMQAMLMNDLTDVCEGRKTK